MEAVQEPEQLPGKEAPVTVSAGGSKHIAWIDTAKGLAISLVVLGHCEPGQSMVRNLIYIFHMPLFFFLSGYLHKPQSRLVAFFKKKTVHLLVPYATFLFLASMVELVHIAKRGSVIPHLEHGLFEVLWGGIYLKGVYGVLWFLPCLFATQQLVNLFLVFFPRTLMVVATVILLALSYVNSSLFPAFTLPLDMNVVAAAAPFFVAGYLFRTRTTGEVTLLLLGMVGLAGSLWGLSHGYMLAYDMRANVYGVPVVTAMLALCCIAGSILMAKQLTRVAALERALQPLGQLSMGIMFLHKELPAVPGYTLLAERGGALVQFCAALGVSYVLALLLYRWSACRALMFGVDADFKALPLLLRWQTKEVATEQAGGKGQAGL